jgi:aquaporin Z
VTRPEYHEPTDDETPWIKDPHDSRYEARRLFTEALGTFFLVAVTVGAIMVDAKSRGGVPLDAQVVAPGLTVIAVIYSMGSVSGAHINPAITFAYALRRNFPWRRVPGYWAAQCVGAIAAVAALRGTLGHVGQLGLSAPGPGVTGLDAFLFELALTLGLVTVTLGTASGENNVGPNAAIARGGYIVAAGLWAAPITGVSMNPARSLASALLEGRWSHLWIYLAGPLVGTLLAVGIAWVLRGPPTRNADNEAQGSNAPSSSSMPTGSAPPR